MHPKFETRDPFGDEPWTVPYTYNPGFIVLSYVISTIGCWTALELLHRRTYSGGKHNWFLLAGAATAMGAVAIWSMHFIGMQAIRMANGEFDLQFVYSPAYTAGSFFLPIGIVAIAFFIFSSEYVSVLKMFAGGFFCGAAICGMHYLGQAGIVNYVSVWDWRYVVGSIVIALVAATTALGMFFRLKSAWTNAIWKRFLNALLLAAAVSLMHWTACLGTEYQWRGLDSESNGVKRATAVWVCGILAMACCLVLLGFAILWGHLRRRYAQRAQEVVVALATWDPEGRILLNPAGLLPCQKVTKTYIERSFDDAFGVDHVAFSWVFRVSRYWQSVVDLIPGMRTNTRSENFVDHSHCAKSEGVDVQNDYSLTFKQLFCVAALDLANTIQVPLENVGILYDRIVDTGTVGPKIKLFSSGNTGNSMQDVESGNSHGMTLGRGQLLFLVRHVNRSEANRLQAHGFNFAPVSTVVDQLSYSMQITSDELRPYLEDLRRYHNAPQLPEPGVHVACFAVRPVVQRGFDILARKKARNLLPSIKLPMDKLQPWHLEILALYDGWEVGTLLRTWAVQAFKDSVSKEQQDFLVEMLNVLKRLSDRVGTDLFRKARLIAKPLQGPCSRNTAKDGSGAHASMICFRVLTDIHWVQPETGLDEFVPSRLFLTQQHAYPHSSDHAVFSGRVHLEFASILKHEPKELPPTTKAASGTQRRFSFLREHAYQSFGSKGRFTKKTPMKHPYIRDNFSEKNLVPVPLGNSFGGVHVSNEISVDVTELDGDEQSPDLEFGDLGVRTEVCAVTETESIMDQLMSLTLGSFSAGRD